MVKILIAGDTGIIGSYLKEKIISNKNNYTIFGLNSSNINLMSIDNIKKFCDLHPTFDVLIFLIGLAHKKGKNKEFNEFKATNYETLYNLLETFKKNKKLPKKIIFSSSICIYGEDLMTDIYTEDKKSNPKTPYAKTKLLAENYLNNTFATNTWILRFSPVYSKDFLINISRRTNINSIYYKVGKGKNLLSLCHIKNIYNTIDNIITNNVPPGTYNISDTKNYTYNDLLLFKNPNFILPIPKFILSIINLINAIIKNLFVEESIIKLTSNNIYPSKKINTFIPIKNDLSNI